MLNKNKIKDIEKLLKEDLSPKPYKYYRLSNGKYILIEPGKNGIKTKIELIFEGEENITGKIFTSLEKMKRKYAGIIDAKSEIEEIINNSKDTFE